MILLRRKAYYIYEVIMKSLDESPGLYSSTLTGTSTQQRHHEQKNIKWTMNGKVYSNNCANTEDIGKFIHDDPMLESFIKEIFLGDGWKEFKIEKEITQHGENYYIVLKEE
jgi:hypothetical protein